MYNIVASLSLSILILLNPGSNPWKAGTLQIDLSLQKWLRFKLVASNYLSMPSELEKNINFNSHC